MNLPSKRMLKQMAYQRFFQPYNNNENSTIQILVNRILYLSPNFSKI